jgi:carboxyl-terminal processing protease
VVSVSQTLKRIVFAISVVIFVTLGLGFILGQFGWIGVHAGDEQAGAYQQMRVYAEVLSKIQNYYVTSPNITAVTDGALHGLLDSLDSDSSYLTPAEYKIYKDRPAQGVAQVGINVSKRFGYATMVSVRPARRRIKEHITDGDVIESIGDQSTRELSLARDPLMLDGKPGTQVTLSVVRPRKPDPDKVTLSRVVSAPVPMAQQDYENSTILYLKPGVLSAARVDEIGAKIKAAGATRKVLLDLRDASGDEAEQGIRLANFFLKQGTLATLSGQKFPTQTFTADPAKWLTDAPVAVLVNRGTYGAAELAAAAILDAKRGDVVGERTFGEGSVQKTIELPDGAALLLTVAKYQSPNGKKIEDEAVTPSVAVEEPIPDDSEEVTPAKGDEPLTKALDLLKAKSA